VRNKRSRSRHGADESRAEGPADDGPRLPFPDLSGQGSPSSSSSPAGSGGDGGESGPTAGRKRRRRRKHSAAGGELFPGAEAPGPGAAPGPSAAPGPAPASPPKQEGRGQQQRRGGRPDQQGEANQGQRRDDREGGRRQQHQDTKRVFRGSGDAQGPRSQGSPGQSAPQDRQRRRPDEGGQFGRRDRREGRAGQDRPREYQPPAPVVHRTPVFGAGDDDIELPPGITGFDAEGRPIFSRQSRPLGKKHTTPVRTLESLSPSKQSLLVLERLDEAIDEVAPLPPKFRAALRGDIRKLWEDLTSDKEHRPADYLGSPASLSAYLRYFLPWNIYRLASILSNADFCLPDRAVIVDIGSGPLTFVIALWTARPELREVPLTIYCVDRVERVMETGLAIFETLCMRLGHTPPPWNIELRKEPFGSAMPERAHLLTAANVFNEFFWKDKGSLGERAVETTRTLLSYLRENGSLFIMEPGDPRSGAFISALRAALIAEGASPLGPCPHAYSCPFPGIFRHILPPEKQIRPSKGDPNVAPSRYHLHPVAMPKKRDKFPWCHFGIDTDEAPRWLQERSEEAGLPKERAVLSYLWAARGVLARPVAAPSVDSHPSERERRARAGNHGLLVRVVSEPFALSEGGIGQYACSNLGYSLIRRSRDDEPFEPGDLLEVQASPLQRNDEKSGAIILPT